MSSHSPVVSDMCVLTQQSGCSRLRRPQAAIRSGVADVRIARRDGVEAAPLPVVALDQSLAVAVEVLGV